MEGKTYGKLYHESVHNTANHGDEVKCIPRVFKVALQRTKKKVNTFHMDHSQFPVHFAVKTLSHGTLLETSVSFCRVTAQTITKDNDNWTIH